jgi:hypothetical protein
MTYRKEPSEEMRVAFLHSLTILDTAQDINLDRIVTLCRQIFDVPVADISLIDKDRQWIKSEQGLGISETSRKDSFCTITIKADRVFEVSDATSDPLVADNPYVVGEPHIRHYMGAPITISGFRIGALCIMDFKPHKKRTKAEREILLELANVVAREIYLQHLLREAIPSILVAASTTSNTFGTGTVVSKGTGTTTSAGVGTTTTTGTGTTTTVGTGTTISTGTGITTTTGTGITTTTGTGTTSRTGVGSTESFSDGLEVTTTSGTPKKPKPKKNQAKKEKG